MQFGKRSDEEEVTRQPSSSNNFCRKFNNCDWSAWLKIVQDHYQHGKLKKLMQSFNQQDTRPYLKVKVLGISLLGLLDSGATSTVIGGNDWQLVKTLGLKLDKPRGRKIKMADGSLGQIIGVVDVPFELEGKIKFVQVLVVPNVKGLILGLDFWREMQIIPDLTTKSWMFKEDFIATSSVEEIGDLGDLDRQQRKQLERIVQSYFQRTEGRIGCAHGVEHKIDTGDNLPIKQRYYPISPIVASKMHQMLDEMLEEDIVEPSKSAWSSPVILVRKRDGGQRFCVDYRKLNQVTKRDAYPLPYVSTILDRLRDAKFLSSLDIKSAYWQVPIEEKSREKTAFTVPGRGLFHFKRMPFGLHNAPATWQRLIDNVLGPELEPYTFVYLDDIIISTSTFAHHLEILNKVFSRLYEAGLTLNKEKCHFCKNELKYLGYIVDKFGLHVDPEKVEAIMSFPQPKTVKQVRRFIGLASWYRRFVPHFSTKIAPITSLLKKNKKFIWTEEQSEAFDVIKKDLANAPLLNCPDFERPFILQTDASTVGLGAILSQINPDGSENVIAYASRTLTKAEQKYSTTELECLAVVWAVSKYRPYVEGSHFKVLTDHSALKWLQNLKDPMGRLARWALKLQGYDYSIEHRSGKSNIPADALSRAPESLKTLELVKEDLDFWYEKMINLVSEDPKKFPNWKIENKLLYRKVSLNSNFSDSEWKQVVPKKKRLEIIRECHDPPTAAHLGKFKTFKRVANKFYWPGMAADISRYVRNCEVCASQKPEQKLPMGFMQNQRMVTEPWQLISTDIMGPLPMTTNRNRWIMVVSDYFTKFSLIFPLKTANSKNICQILENDIFCVYGAPRFVICDNGPQFRSEEFKRKLAEYQAKPLYNPNYHPQANATERVNRVVKTAIRSYIKENQRHWDRHLPQIGYALRSAIHETTGYSPNFLNFGREVVISGKDRPSISPVDIQRCQSFDEHTEKLGNLPLIWYDVADKIRRAYEASARSYNLRRRPAILLKPGDLVWKRNYQLSDAGAYFSSKLAPKFLKCRVKKNIGPTTYELEDLGGKSLGTWHVQDLKMYAN